MAPDPRLFGQLVQEMSGSMVSASSSAAIGFMEKLHHALAK